MSKKRNKRRFYPEFYTDEELELQQNDGQENVGNDAPVVPNEPVEIKKETEEYPVANIFDRSENLNARNKNINNNEVNNININNTDDNLNQMNPDEILIEIPESMYINELSLSDGEPAPPQSNPLIYTFNPGELSETENEEINKIFDIVSSVPTFAELPKLNENMILKEPEPEPVLEIEPEIKEEETEKFPPPEINMPESHIITFDREKAIEYARRWALDRNPNFFNFEELGGDCTNYISQILLAGGCRMDKSSSLYGWYYNNANDKSPSWTGVDQLYNYLVKEKEYGTIAAEIDASAVEAGDIAQISFNGKTFQHTPFIISVKRDPLGAITFDRIKVCAHSFDSDNRPLDTYQFRKIRFIRILGHKEK